MDSVVVRSLIDGDLLHRAYTGSKIHVTHHKDGNLQDMHRKPNTVWLVAGSQNPVWCVGGYQGVVATVQVDMFIRHL